MRKLLAAEREFFSRVALSAFTNPFSDEREQADRETMGGAPSAGFDEVLESLLTELAQRLNSLAQAGRVDCSQYSGAEQEALSISILFLVFHQNTGHFDTLIQRQIAMEGESSPAPFAGKVFQRLQEYGFTAAEAALYVAMFYQVRRAFHFISQSLIGGSPCMKQLRRQLWDNLFTHDVRWYVRCLWNRMEDFSTLLLGETGTGKGAAAFALGRSGFIPFEPQRSCFAESFTRAFVPINLSQFPETLIESELFGHRKGAFTGAVEKHDGVFSRCSAHGAIFLDEIGDVSEPVQIKLLQVLQQRVFSPVGGHDTLRFSGRMIAATNRSLDALRREGRFRDDFYYRLCSDQITMPPLRLRLQESPAELEALTRHILQRISGEVMAGVLEHVLGVLRQLVREGYPWPGNVRELEQAVRRILLSGTYAGDQGSSIATAESTAAAAVANGELTVQELTALYCRNLFERFGSYSEVARRTGLDWRTAKRYVGEG